MHEKDSEIVEKVFCEVLENFAFLFGDPCKKNELIANNKAYLSAMINFRGSRHGIIGVAAPVDLCVEMAAGILGIDSDDDDAGEKAGDALKEFINIMCGQLLTTIYGDEEIFNMSIPEIESMDENEWQNLVDRPETIGLLVDDSPIVGYLSLENGLG